MEAFSLLKYWRGGGGGLGGSGGGDGDGGGGGTGSSANLRTTANIVTAATHNAAETDDDDDDDGPFFDLEFAVQDEEIEGEERGKHGAENENENDDVDSEDDDGNEEEDEREFNFTISSNSSSSASNNECTDPNLTLSPSDDLFFKGRLVPIESSSFNSSEPNSKSQFPVSLLKSATKFRVFMLGFKKMKQNNASEKTEANSVVATAAADSTTATTTTTPKQQQQQQPKQDTEKTENEKEKPSKFFTVKFNVEEAPIVSLFTRNNNSSRKSQKQSVEDSTSDEKKFSKDVMQKYLKKVKPLYIRVSKRYGEKLKFSGQLSLGSVTKSVQSPPSTIGRKLTAPKSTAEKRESEVEQADVESQVKSQKQANIPERLRVACKHLGKSRSASSAVAAAPAPAAPVISRRDDSLVQQQDGIQSAILHCKRSINASRDSESSMLPRYVSDRSHQKSAVDLSRKSSDHEGIDESFEA